MKTFRLFKGEYRWFTELGAKIANNDLLNDIRICLNNYKALTKPSKRKRGGK